MTFEPEKFLQNIELRLRGRTAFLAIGSGALVLTLWVVLRSYSEHPQFSTIGGYVSLAAIILFLAIGLLGKSRPEEEPEKSITQVTKMGVLIARGVGSHKEMIQIMRQNSGISRLPAPTHEVHGSAANPANYIPLTPEQSAKLIENIERQVEETLKESLASATGQRPHLQELGPQEPEPQEPDRDSLIQGKKLLP